MALSETVAEFGIPIDPFDGPDLGVRAGSGRHRLRHLRSTARLLHPLGQPGRPSGPVPRAVVQRRERPAGSNLTCTGLQLANHWQDVARDLTSIDRIYLPREDRERFGVTDQDLRACGSPRNSPRCMRFEVDRARDLLQRGWPLVNRMPRALAVDVDLFTRGGLAILDRIERQRYRRSLVTASNWKVREGRPVRPGLSGPSGPEDADADIPGPSPSKPAWRNRTAAPLTTGTRTREPIEVPEARS